MAKKPNRKPGSKSKPKSPSKRPTRKPSITAGSPEPLSTGKGPGPREIGEQLVRNFNRGKFEVDHKLWSPTLVSIEGLGFSFTGRKNVEAKNRDWNTKHAIHGAAAEGPFVGATGFAVKFRMDIEEKSTRNRTIMEEVGVYTVRNGKIVREEFMYGSMTPAAAAAPPSREPAR